MEKLTNATALTTTEQNNNKWKLFDFNPQRMGFLDLDQMRLGRKNNVPWGLLFRYPYFITQDETLEKEKPIVLIHDNIKFPISFSADMWRKNIPKNTTYV